MSKVIGKPTRQQRVINWLKKPLHLLIVIGVIGGIGYGGWRIMGERSTQPQYQTAIAERGSLITSVSASGNVTTGNSLTVTTTATGTVKNVYFKNGDKVTAGQKIAEIDLDQDSLQRQTAAWASYLSAKNSLAQTQTNLYTLQSKEFAANQVFMKGAVANNDSTSEPTYIQQNADWLAAEAAYKNQAGVIAQAQANLSSSWLNYRQVASVITAGKSGLIKNLTIAPGSVISSSTTSTSNSAAQQQLATISDVQGSTQTVVGLSEIDVVAVAAGQKATLTLDALPDKTFTGKVLIVNTNGQVSSGVTTYPATIIFDSPADSIYPNMAVSAKIITGVQDNMILVSSAAIQTSGGASTVRVLKDGQVSTVTVEVGGSNDTQTAIISGINEGDTVVTGVTNSATTGQTSVGASPFSLFGGRQSGGGGGGVVRRIGGD